MFIILLSTHSVAHPLRHPDKDNPGSPCHHAGALLLAGKPIVTRSGGGPRAVGLLDTKGKPQIAWGPPG